VTATREQELLEMFNSKSRIGALFGMKLSYAEDGSAVVSLPYNPNLDHSFGAVHGGVYATMLDVAGWFAAASKHETGTLLVTSQLSVNFLRPVVKSSLKAVGRVIHAGKRQNTAQMDLFDAAGHLVGHATGTFVMVEKR
jgi:uncharacterized protein (TIGR00369 family)